MNWFRKAEKDTLAIKPLQLYRTDVKEGDKIFLLKPIYFGGKVAPAMTKAVLVRRDIGNPYAWIARIEGIGEVFISEKDFEKA